MRVGAWGLGVLAAAVGFLGNGESTAFGQVPEAGPARAATPENVAAATRHLLVVMEPTSRAEVETVGLADRLVDQQPDSADAWKLLGDAMWAARRPSTRAKSAGEAYARAVSLAPGRKDCALAWAQTEIVRTERPPVAATKSTRPGRDGVADAAAMRAVDDVLAREPKDPVANCLAARRTDLPGGGHIQHLVNAPTCLGPDGHSLFGRLNEEGRAWPVALMAFATTVRGPWPTALPEWHGLELQHRNLARLDLARAHLAMHEAEAALRQFRWIGYVQQDAAMQFLPADELKRLLGQARRSPGPSARPATPEGAVRAFERAALDGDGTTMARIATPDGPLGHAWALARANPEQADGETSRCWSAHFDPQSKGGPGQRKDADSLWGMCVLEALDFPDLAYVADCSTTGDRATCRLSAFGARWSVVELERAGREWRVDSVRKAPDRPR